MTPLGDRIERHSADLHKLGHRQFLGRLDEVEQVPLCPRPLEGIGLGSPDVEAAIAREGINRTELDRRLTIASSSASEVFPLAVAPRIAKSPGALIDGTDLDLERLTWSLTPHSPAEEFACRQRRSEKDPSLS